MALADYGIVFADVAPLIEAMNLVKKQAASKLEEFIASTKDFGPLEKPGEDSPLMKMNITVEAPIILVPLRVRYITFFLLLFATHALLFSAGQRREIDHQPWFADGEERVRCA